MSKYEPLNEFLGRLKADYWRPTFLELERILDFKLPSGARKDDAWWTAAPGGRHAHAKAWAAAGWRVQDVSVDKEKVTFVRTGAPVEDDASDLGLADALRDRADQAREWGAAQRDAAAQQLRERPLTAIGVSAGLAFGIGLALGYLLVRADPEPEPEPTYGSRAEELARRAMGVLAAGQATYGARAEEAARKALGALSAGVHELEDVVRERIDRLRH
jgi:hypothetical protein